MAAADRLCETCAVLNLVREDFVEPPFERGRHDGQLVVEGSLGALRKSQNCPLCRLILYTILKNERGSLPNNDDVQWALSWSVNNPEYEPTKQNEDFWGSGLYANLSSSEGQREYRIELVDDDPASGFLRARKLSQDGIDVHRLHGWIRDCRDAHGIIHKKSYFKDAIQSLNQQHFRVIDVRKRCLTMLGEGEEYIALSYVWGTKNNVMTTKANLEEFSSEGALSNVPLPRTIRDAINLTAQLGYSYLWIDSLCIVQDDQTTKLQLIASMGRIYANATVTIIGATGSDADAGLSGFGIDSRVSSNMLLETIRPGLQLGVIPHFMVELMESCHATRGWTFQETCLSPRCLVFLNGCAYYSCMDALWREDVVESPKANAAGGANTFGRDIWDQPLQQYAEFVGPYSERNLTFQSDGLHAFTGVLDALSETLSKSRMFYGIPAAIFDWALLWEGMDELTRRSCFPSWAWVGFSGREALPSPFGPELDQEWLLRRTWIDWHILFQSQRNLIPVWDPDRDETLVADIAIIDEDAEEDEGEGAETTAHHEEEESEDEEEGVSEGEDEDESKDEYDEPCPTYGSPSPASIYGRQNILMPHTWPPKSQDTSSCTNDHPLPPYPDGTLHFTTLSLRFRIDGSFLLDSQGRKCGVLRGPMAEPSEHNAGEYEVLVLSWASPGTTGGGHAHTKELDTEYRVSDEARSEGGGADVQWEPLVGEWHAWAYFNVLVVKQSELNDQFKQQKDTDDALFERVGIGLLHLRALDRAQGDGLRWRKVWLY